MYSILEQIRNTKSSEDSQKHIEQEPSEVLLPKIFKLYGDALMYIDPAKDMLQSIDDEL